MELPGSGAQPTLRVPSETHPTLGSALAAVAASSASGTTIRLAAGVYREGTLHLCRGVSLVGAGSDTVLESEGTVLVCDGAALVSDISVRQVGGDASGAAYGIEVRSGSLLVERCDVAASCGAKLAAAVLARGAAVTLRLRECKLHDCGGAGLLLASKASADVQQSVSRTGLEPRTSRPQAGLLLTRLSLALSRSCGTAVGAARWRWRGPSCASPTASCARAARAASSWLVASPPRTAVWTAAAA